MGLYGSDHFPTSLTYIGKSPCSPSSQNRFDEARPNWNTCTETSKLLYTTIRLLHIKEASKLLTHILDAAQKFIAHAFVALRNQRRPWWNEDFRWARGPAKSVGCATQSLSTQCSLSACRRDSQLFFPGNNWVFAHKSSFLSSFSARNFSVLRSYSQVRAVATLFMMSW